MSRNPAWCTGPLVLGPLSICQPMSVFISVALDIFFIWQFIRNMKSDIYKTPWIYLFVGYMIMSTSAILQRTIWSCDYVDGNVTTFIQRLVWEFLMVGGYYMVAQFGIAGALNDLGWIDWSKQSTRVFNYYLAIAVASYQFFSEFFATKGMSKATEEILFAVPGLAVLGGIIVTNVLLGVYVCKNRLVAHRKLMVALFVLSAVNVFGLASFVVRGNECWYYLIEAACTMALWVYVLQSRILAEALKRRSMDEPSTTGITRTPVNTTQTGVEGTGDDGHYVAITSETNPHSNLTQRYTKTCCIDSNIFQRTFVRGGLNINIPRIDLSNPSSYKGGRVDPITRFCDRQFKKMAYFLPTNFSPNVLTISGLVISFVGELPAAVFIWSDYLTNGTELGYQFFTLPRYMYILIVIGVEMDWVLDAMDGEYARITNQQSCARHVFDHITDVLQRIFTPIVCTALLPIRDMPLAYFIPVLTVMSELALFIPFSRYLFTGQFQLCMGLRLTSHSLNIYMLICAGAGGELWEQSIPFTIFCVWFGSIFLLVLFEILEHVYAIVKSNFSWGEIVQMFLTPLMIFVLLVFSFATGLARREPFGVSVILGVTFCAYTNHVMTQQHLQRIPAVFPVELWISWVGFVLAAVVPDVHSSITVVFTTAFALTCSYCVTTHLLLNELKVLPNGNTFTIFVRKRHGREALGTTSLQPRAKGTDGNFVDSSPPIPLLNSPSAQDE